MRLYRKGVGANLDESVESLRDENSVLMGSDSENIFLVYLYAHCARCIFLRLTVPSSFFFTLQEFAKEMISLTDAMSRICNIQRETSWLMRPWRYVQRKIRRLRQTASEKRRSGLRRRVCTCATFVVPLPADLLASGAVLQSGAGTQGRRFPQNHTTCAEHETNTSAAGLVICRPRQTVNLGIRRAAARE